MPNIQSFSKKLRKNLTNAENQLWQKLRNRQFQGFKFYRQRPFYPYIADFYCPELKLIIEIDGATHWTEEEKNYDAERTQWFLRQGFLVLRFTNLDIYHNLDGVLNTLFQTFSKQREKR
jgi:very-short-patch-repair endonuclease